MKMEIYEAVRSVPVEAQKTIGGGRLKGMTDINPMWRIKKLTEQFGPCGIGWYYEITEKWVETCGAKDEITANVRINLYYKHAGEWSKPVEGIGGSMLVATEKGGLYVNDECYKMALTDAISVACKAIGMGADVYWNKDTTKYNDTKRENFIAGKQQEGEITTEIQQIASEREIKVFQDTCSLLGVDFKDIGRQVGATSLKTMTKGQHGQAMAILKEIEDGKR